MSKPLLHLFIPSVLCHSWWPVVWRPTENFV